MRLHKTYKLGIIVSAALFLIFALILFSRINDIVTLFLLTKYAEESSINTNLIYLFFWLTFVVGILMFLFYLKTNTEKQIDDEETVADNTKVEKKQYAEDEIQREIYEKQQKEKAKKNIIIDQIMRDLEGRSDLKDFSDKLLSNIARQFDIVQGLVFIKNPKTQMFKMVGNYAWYSEEEPREFSEGEGLSGQVAKNRKLIEVNNVPDKYITIVSGLGSSSPNHLIIFPILFDSDPIAIIELAAFKPFPEDAKVILDGVSRIIGSQIIDRFDRFTN